MAKYFLLTRKSTKRIVSPLEVDENIALMFDYEDYDSRYWYCHWHDVIGFKLLCDKDFKSIREELFTTLEWYKEHQTREREIVAKLIAICDWLSANFTVTYKA